MSASGEFLLSALTAQTWHNAKVRAYWLLRAEAVPTGQERRLKFLTKGWISSRGRLRCRRNQQ
jgi:hypothetical protein